MSTLAIGGSSGVARGGPGALARYADLALLALALPIFLIAGWPMLGYAAAAAAWLAARGLGLLADRRAARALAAGERRTAMGTIAAAALGRVWIVTMAILLVGLLADREDGLAAAVLSAAVVTAYFAGRMLGGVMAGSEGNPR